MTTIVRIMVLVGVVAKTVDVPIQLPSWAGIRASLRCAQSRPGIVGVLQRLGWIQVVGDAGDLPVVVGSVIVRRISQIRLATLRTSTHRAAQQPIYFLMSRCAGSRA